MTNRSDVTALLNRWSDGDRTALNAALPVIYAELRRAAHAYLRQERNANTLQPTALINEAIARLLGGRRPELWQNRKQFVGVIARTMREVLVDHARRHQAAKRPNRAHQVDLDSVEIAADDGAILAVDESLRRLAQVHPRQAHVVELKYFGGLTLDEIAEVTKSSEATVTRDWRLARAWLQRDIENSGY